MTDPAQVSPAAPKAPSGVITGLTGLVIAMAEAALSTPGQATERAEDGSEHRHAHEVVCQNCPICRLAVRLEQIDPHVVTDLADVARDLLVGLAASMAAATRDRTGEP